jgi:O-antigen ligase
VVRKEEWRVMLFLAIVITIAVSIPHPITKQIIMGILGVFIGTIFLKDIRLAVCLLPLLIPAQNLVPKGFIPIPGINYETLLMGLLLASWAAQRGKFEPKRPAKPMPGFVVIVCVFLGWLLMAAFRTYLEGRMDAYTLFSIFKNQWIYFTIFFVVSDSLRDERDRIRLMIAVCIAIILVSIQPIQKGTTLLASGVSLARQRAVSILALQSNVYGGALACFATFPMIYFARRIGGKKGRILFGLSIAVAVYALVLTLSRGSWLAFGTAIAITGVFFERRVLYILAVGILTAPFWVPQDAVDRGNTISEIDVTDQNLQDDEGSAFVRVDQWKMIPRVLTDSPILGHGFQSFPRMYYRFGSLGVYKGSHVGYAEYASEVGVPGLALYVLCFISLGAFGFMLAIRGATLFTRSHGVGILGAALAMVVAEAFGSRFKIGTVTAFLWMYAGVGVAAWRWPAQESVESAIAAQGVEHRGLVSRGPRSRGASKRRLGAPSRSLGLGRDAWLR